ncbi:kelch domain-containing protein 4-like isoform X2 [Daktulosphaira vitifoliae]|uniref:kelch domain-containing protein 4-like isoform X2 n=1 Tax=Daktulosphaira vitifoliae TaxID=58002 RepID=UPI0021AAE0EE|nr:kelch domain-containing protein 4-like isoform X2 [Daktulosphaira vitifoliae]
MGKNKKKSVRIEKAAIKKEKKIAQRIKKDISKIGEPEVSAIVAHIEAKNKAKIKVTNTKIEAPSRRSNFTFVPHPNKDEIILFGGEYHNGKNTVMYNDLIFYNINNNTWTITDAPGAPPPRSSHSCVTTASDNGQLWIFGGEFASPSEYQFYHYNDLWVFSLKTKNWTKIATEGGPSARSGHRMVLCKRHLIVFGGFQDNTHSYQYFNDIYAFSLENYEWKKIKTTGQGPSPRSGCQMFPIEDGRILIYGGYFKEKVKKDCDKGTMLIDMFILTPEKGVTDYSNCRWSKVKQTGNLPTVRCSLSSTIITGHNKSFLFGGVYDEEEEEDDLKSIFYNDLFMLDMEQSTPTWKLISIKDLTIETDTVAELPSPRSHSGLAFKHNMLYVYGGIIEKGSKSLVLSDFYSIDTKKFNKWNVICKDNILSTVNSDTSSDDMSTDKSSSDFSDSNLSSEDDSDEHMDTD